VQVNIDEAVAIYARACRAWYGGRAEQVARRELQKQRRKGDISGIATWEKLVGVLAKSSGQPRSQRHPLPDA
jgi:hypothetical protein